MADRFRSDATRPPLPGARQPGGADDPLAELARIVSEPSGLEARTDRLPAAHTLAEDLESELAGSGVDTKTDPFVGAYEWPSDDQADTQIDQSPSTAAAGETAAEADFDEFAHMHLRQAARLDAPRAQERDAAPSGTWDAIEVEQPDDDIAAALEPLTMEATADLEALEPPLGEDAEAAAADDVDYSAEYADEDTADPLVGEIPLDPYAAADGPDADFGLGRYGEEGFDDEADSLRYEPERAVARGGMSSGLVMAGAAAVAVVVLLGGGVLAYRVLSNDGGSAGSPAVVMADSEPVKVAPPRAGGNDPAPASKSIYDRAAPAPAERMASTEPANTAAPQPGAAPSAGSREISRIILPDAGTDGGKPASAPPPPVAGANPPSSGGGLIEPRRVRTVVVRPDGTIVSSSPAAGGAKAPPTGATAAPASADPAPTPAPTGSGPVPRPNPDRSAASDPGSERPAPDVAKPAAATNTTVVTSTVPGQGANAADRVPQGGARAPVPTRVATRSTGPVSLLPGQGGAPAPAPAAAAPAVAAAPAAAAAPPASDASGYVVQVTSQRSESAATAEYRNLQQRYPSLLGGKQADMQKADLGSRGTFYRMRVGPATTAEAATAFCSSLKAAGADCVVVRN